MKIVKLETFLANCGLRNYLFLRLTTDTGLTGIGSVSEATIRDIGHWEVVVSGTAPPVAVTNGAEDDWVYGWISG